MAYKKITEQDLKNIGVIGLPDTPGLSTRDMQAKFEETARSVIIPRHNRLVDSLTELGRPVESADIKRLRRGSDGDMQMSLNGTSWLGVVPRALAKKADKTDTYTKTETNRQIDAKIAGKSDKSDTYTKAEILNEINQRVKDIGAGDMARAVYDPDGDGVVEKAASAKSAESAAKLSAARKINGVAFDGTKDITITDETGLALDGSSVMTGDIKRKAGGYTFKPITVYEGDNNGAIMLVQSGGLMFMGGGESANSLYQKLVIQDKVYNGGNEQTFVTSDNRVHFYTNGNTEFKHAEVDTNGNMILHEPYTGVFGKDKTGFAYPLVWDNTTNLFIGAKGTAFQHHTGGTIISAGHDGTKGNDTIMISVPNDANDGATNYPVIHGSANGKTQTIAGSLILSNATDASVTQNNDVALVIGSKSGRHMEFDNNEIITKASATELAQLTINETVYIMPQKYVFAQDNINNNRSGGTYRNIEVRTTSATGALQSTGKLIGVRR